MDPSRRVILAVLCLSLVVCVLGRPQPSSASPQYSTVEVLENSSLQGSNRIFGFLPFGTLEVPWRRSLKGGGGGGGGGRGGRGGGGRVGTGGGGGGGGGGGTSTTVTIIVVVSTVTFVLLLTALACWCASKKKKSPNWRPMDCFKRNKFPREKMFTSVKSDVDPDAYAEYKVAIDVPRLDQTAKSRKQVSLSHDFKDSSSLN